MIVNKTILLVSPEEWEGNQVSKHHYARNLAMRGNKVFFLNPGLTEYYFQNVSENLYSIGFHHHRKGIRWLGRRIQARSIFSDFKKLEESLNQKFDVIWNFDSSRFFELTMLEPSVLKICHMVDLNQDFQRKSLARCADICLGNSTPIINELKKYNQNTFKIGHGVEIPDENLVFDRPIPGQNETKVVYSGNLDIEYLDHELLHKLFKGFTCVDFLLIGNCDTSNPLNRIKYDNVFMLGKIESELLIPLYRMADLLLVTYDIEKHLEQLANPHKILEYMASGKAILATRTLEYEQNSLVEMAGTHEDFIWKFRTIVDEKEKWNSFEKQESRISFAKDNSYSNQLDRIEKLLDAL